MAGSAFSEEEGALVTDINVTPLVDVTLVLLIVFMITVPAAIQASAPIKVDVPESTSAGMDEAGVLPLNIYVRREDNGEIGMYLNDTKTDDKRLRQLLESTRVPGIDQPIYISGERTINYNEVVRVLDLLTSMGMHKISLVTKHVD